MIKIGLDWHTAIPIGRGYEKPCSVVNAPKAKERPTYKDDIAKLLSTRKREAEEADKSDGHKNNNFIKYWRSMTLEQLIREEADKYDCENCPLLKELNGSDSTDSLFLGLTVATCDFRGKMIGSDDAISEELRDKAYEKMDQEEMLLYAYNLEKELDRLRKVGELNKQPYEKYSEEWHKDSYPFKPPLLNKEEYANTPHWRERNIRKAIHWLRTCAKHGVSMRTSY